MRPHRRPLRSGPAIRIAGAAAALACVLALAGGTALARTQDAVNTALPTISGPAGVGGTFTGTDGTWTGTGTITFAYRWLRCDTAGANCALLPPEENKNFRVLTADDVGHTMRLQVTATDTSMNPVNANSAQSAVVVATPVNFGEPAVTGNPVVGATLTATDGSWTGSPTSFNREWRRCPASGGAPDAADCSPISGATFTSYTVTSSDLGSRLRFRVSASNAAGASANTVASNATAVISGTSQSGAPVNTVFPSVAGSAVQGQTMTATPGTWTGAAPITFSYQWLRCDTAGLNCVSIVGATTAQYVPSTTDVGSRLRARVTATNSAGSTIAQSNASAVVSATGGSTGTGPPVNTTPPTISGTAENGETLSASRGVWTGATPITYTFRWMRCTSTATTSCTAIAGATDDQLELGNADVSRRIRVEVTAENDAGEETELSAATAEVAETGTSGGGDEQQQPTRCTMSIPGAVDLPGDEISIPSTSVSLPEQLVAAGVSFTPNPVRSRSRPLRVTVLVQDTRGCVVRDALVFVRSVPLVTSSLQERPTGRNGTVSARLTLRQSFPIKDNGRVQFFIRVRKPGDPVLTGVGSRRLVQVGTEAP
jgi:hypothetical protein